MNSLNSGVSNTIDDTDLVNYWSKSLKGITPHIGRKTRPKDLIKKINNRDQLKLDLLTYNQP